MEGTKACRASQQSSDMRQILVRMRLLQARLPQPQTTRPISSGWASTRQLKQRMIGTWRLNSKLFISFLCYTMKLIIYLWVSGSTKTISKLFSLEKNDEICYNSADNTQQCGAVHREESHGTEQLQLRGCPLQLGNHLPHPPVFILQLQTPK